MLVLVRRTACTYLAFSDAKPCRDSQWVKTLNEQSFRVGVKDMDVSVDDLKVLIQKQKEIEPACMRLVFRGQVLTKGGQSLQEVGMASGCTVHLVVSKVSGNQDHSHMIVIELLCRVRLRPPQLLPSLLVDQFCR